MRQHLRTFDFVRMSGCRLKISGPIAVRRFRFGDGSSRFATASDRPFHFQMAGGRPSGRPRAWRVSALPEQSHAHLFCVSSPGRACDGMLNPMAEFSTMLPIDSIRPDFQGEEYLDRDKVESFAAAIRGGEALPPIIVRFDGETYWLQDGFHLLHSAKALGQSEIAVEIRPGSYSDIEAEWQAGLKALNAWAAERDKCIRVPNPGR